MGAVRGAGVRARGRLTPGIPSNPSFPFWRGNWTSLVREAPAELLVEDQPDPGGARLVCLNVATSTAIVLGSSQPDADVDAGRAHERDIAVVRRRSGGGAVFVAPGAQVWLDVFVPADDPLFDRDVVAASFWVGRAWGAALASAFPSNGERFHVHERTDATRWSRKLCFSGRGPGEVSFDRRKVVGLAQRRSRAGAWFFSMCVVENEQTRLADLLTFATTAERREVTSDLDATVGRLGGSEQIEAALGDELSVRFSARENVPPEPHPSEADRDAAGNRTESEADGA